MHVTINNFQAIRDVSFNIEGFTVLLGENDIGKSSTFRALQSVFKNRSGDDFISLGTSTCTVALQTDVSAITWSKNRKTGAEYTYNGQSYVKTGRKAPEFISQIGYGDLELATGKLDPHFSYQGESPFLLSTSGQLLTEFFSEILKFGQLGRASLACGKDLKETQAHLKVLESEKVRSEETLTQFDNLPGLETLYAECLGLQQEASRIEELCADISEYLEATRILEDMSKNVPPLETALEELSYAQSLLDLVGVLYDFVTIEKTPLPVPGNLSEVTDLLKEAIKTYNLVKSLFAFTSLEPTPSVDEGQLRQIEADITLATNLLSDVTLLYEYINLKPTIDLHSIQDTLDTITNELCLLDLACLSAEINVLKNKEAQLREDICLAENQYEEYLIKMKFCPLCEQSYHKGREHKGV